ncbi:hypothetical protein MPSEU_000272000 [Mayamaea pseudoterrestris]|nr:hypothetical protein MPSEU_000272000 [Mayamaea pseudoterrestris]
MKVATPMTKQSSFNMSTKQKLDRLASKQTEWRELGLDRKLDHLEQMLHNLKTSSDELKGLGRQAASTCMGYSLSTAEGECEASMQYLVFAVFVMQHLVHLIASYKVILKRDKAPKELVASKKSNGQVAVKVFPILPGEKTGPNSKGVAELYLDPTHVKSIDDVQLFALDAFQTDASKEGVMIVLGAGNQGMLTVADALQGLFVSNRVVLVKHHPLREYQDEMIRKVFEPLISEGYMECEMDNDFDKSSLYFGPNLVAGVHVTGGKATHDAIVWGPDKESRVAKNDPLLKCPMTSELGCVTPWIMTPFEYTASEMEAQVLALFTGVSSNASCNCNAPKVVLVSEEWKQLPQFLEQLTEYLNKRTVPAAYYPGATQRWEQFRKQYSDAKQLGHGVNAKERMVSSPTLPWLLINIDLKLDSEQGWADAKQEYALLHEPFAPVLTIATVSGPSNKFLKHVTKLCNNSMFGNLSASMSVPENMKADSRVEECISELRYGSVCLNTWSATGYTTLGGIWGAYPGETLDKVESGIGQIHNFWLIPHAQKCVVRMPCVSSANDIFKKEDFVKNTIMFRSIGDFLLNPGVGTFVRFLAAQVDVSKRVLYGGGAVAIAVGVGLVRKIGLF